MKKKIVAGDGSVDSCFKIIIKPALGPPTRTNLMTQLCLCAVEMSISEELKATTAMTMKTEGGGSIAAMPLATLQRVVKLQDTQIAGMAR